MRQKSAAATKQALSSLHDAGAPEVPDLDPVPAAAPSTLASEMPMATPEEGMRLSITYLPCSQSDGTQGFPRGRHVYILALPSILCDVPKACMALALPLLLTMLATAKANSETVTFLLRVQ